MKKLTTAILLFDLMAGLLFLGLWKQRKAENPGGVLAVETAAKSGGIAGTHVKVTVNGTGKQKDRTDF